MNDRPDPDLEARLRAALADRADSVEPAPGTEAATVGRMAAARAAAGRRRAVLSAAAVVAVIAAVAGAFVLLGDDDPDTEVATGDTITTTTTAVGRDAAAPGQLAIWPLPTTSVRYDDSNDAAEAFGREYLGIAGACVDGAAPLEGASGTVAVANGCAALPAGGPTAPTTEVLLERRATGWVVTGAESNRFEVTAPALGATTGANIEVLVEGVAAGSTLTAKVPALGQHPAPYPAVDTTTIPLGADGTWRLVLGAADGATVLIVSDGATATARSFVVDGASVPPDTTTTTTGATDDGVVGWPGPTSRHFDTAEAAAQAFVSEVLGFADPALADLTQEGADAIAEYLPRPTAAIVTSIAMHDTGSARGWVVTAATSTQGTIGEVFLDEDRVVVTGSATAFEAQVYVALLDETGQVLVEGGALAGSNGEIGPFEAVLANPGVAADYVLIGEADASGAGRFTWAVMAPLRFANGA